jgi:DNA-binding Xre family transcriptional regulator
MSAWIARLLVLVVRLVRVPVPGAGTVTTAMLHRRGPDHGNAPSSWFGTIVNLSILKNRRAKAIRFSTPTRLCEVLGCQPGDLMSWRQE